MTELELLQQENDMLVVKIKNQLDDIDNLIKEINKELANGTN